MRACLLIIFISLCTTTLSFADSLTLSVEEAYALIPHKQTRYDHRTSPIDKNQKTYFHQLFSLTDFAVIVRVELLQKMYHQKPYNIQEYERIYESILSKIDRLEPASHLKGAQILVKHAIEDQRKFFMKWHHAEKSAKQDYKRYSSHPLVARSSSNLKVAYGIYMQSYPQESSSNKQAFFDHLCALDFI